MALEFKLPEMGEGVNEGELVRWLVKEGDSVKQDQPLVEMMTDKATVEIPSPSSGKVAKLVAKEGDTVKVGQTLLTLDSEQSNSASAKTTAPAKPNAATPISAAPTTSSKPAAVSTGPSFSGAGTVMYPPAAGSNVLATPSTRRYAREAGVDINVIPGSGPAGRVTREDVMKIASTGAGAVSYGTPTISNAAYTTPNSQAGPNSEVRTPFKGIRKKIAENLVKSKHTIPHFTHVDEADVTELVQWRSQMKEEAARMGVKLTYLPLIMKALVVTAREFPSFNSMLDEQKGELVQKKYFNIGFAADTPEGLLVPNVKNVERKNILQLAQEITALAEKARTGKLAPDDMRHGTITITNIGSIGGLYATPIINPPEVAIIGVYEIIKKPVVLNGQIVVRDMMNITATCDHRVVDGADAARFLKKLKARLSQPQALLLEMV